MTTPSAADLTRLLADWNEWLSARTDALLSLEERVRSAGSRDDEADLAAAFVARKAIADRIEQIGATASTDRATASGLAAQPIHDDLGGVVGNSLSDAATLLDAVVQRVEHSVAGREQQQRAEAGVAHQADADLAVASRLAAELGMQVNHVAQLRAALAARSDLAEVAREAKAVRTSLEAADAERSSLLQRWGSVADRLEALAHDEVTVRELAARCREKVLHPPPLAVPSVEAFRTELAGDGDLATALSPTGLVGLPWSAVRGRITPVLTKVDRIAAALAEAERRFQHPLRRRDELRGLLQAFADKASAAGLMESTDIDSLYQRAKAVLWAAPCDVDAGATLVDQYVTAVNTEILKGTPR